MKKHLLLACLVVFTASYAQSQCEFDINAQIFSQELGQYEIVVSGLQQSDLASDQQVCGVRLFFDHTSLTNLRISLISPDGDRVFLVGPAVLAPTITDFTDWNVEFVPCNNPAAPDPGIPDLWSNNSSWNSIDTYVGSYYPSGGCLEDFDSGSANGIWTIEVEDLGDLNDGTLYSVELIFCNDDGLACQICDAQVVDFLSDQQVYCAGDATQLIPSSLITQSSNQSTIPALILVQNDQIIEIVDDTLSISNLSVGTYKVYGAAILDGGDYTSYITIQDLDSALIGGNECGDLSIDPIDLTILEVIATETFMAVLCDNEPFVWEQQVFTAPLDTVIYTFDSPGVCSVSTEINLILQDSGLEISESFEVVECGEEVVLTASLIDPNQDYLWTTIDGSIVGGSTTPFVIVNQPGTYYLYGAEDCSPADSIMLSPASNFGQVSITVNSGDCSESLAVLGIESDIAITDFYWLGLDIEGSNELNPTVSQYGDYGLVVFSDEMVCDSIIVYASFTDITDTVQEILKVNDLDCEQRSTELYVELGGATLLDLKWYDPLGALVGNELNLIASQRGVYTVSITYLNGCTETLSIEVIDTKLTYDLNVDVVLLDCNTQQGFASIITNGPIEAVVWTGPFGFYSEESVAELNSFGTYRAIVQYADGCRQAYFFEVDYDANTSPVVDIEASEITCNDECGLLTIVSGHDPSYTYNWAGPAGFQSSLINPKVFNPGNYFVTVTDNEGCESIYFALVGSNVEGIRFDIVVEELTCANLNTELMITTDFSQIVSFTWSGPGIDASNATEQIPVVSIPGIYTITGIGINGCDFEESVEVIANNIPAVITNDQETFILPCVGASAMIEAMTDQPVLSYEWSVPFEFGPTLEVSEPGTYTITITNQDQCSTVGEYTVTLNQNYDFIISTTSVNLTCEMPTSDITVVVNSLDPNLSNIADIEAVTPDGTQAGSSLTAANEGQVTFTQVGEYLLTVTLDNGCILTEDISVTGSLEVVMPALDIPTYDCYSPDGILVMLNNAEMYTEIQWTNGIMTLSNGSTHLHTNPTLPLMLNLVDINGCELQQEIDFEIDLDVPDLELQYSSSLDCEVVSGALMANSSSEVEYNWSTLDGQILSDPTGQSIQIQGNGEYTCEVSALSNGCTESLSYVVEEEVGIGSVEFILTQPSCDNNALVIEDFSVDGQGFDSGDYRLYVEGQLIPTLPYSIVENGEFNITIENSLECTTDTLIPALLFEEFVAQIDPVYTINEGESVEVSAEIDTQLDAALFDLDWSIGVESEMGLEAVYQPIETSDYTVLVTGPTGCSQMLEFTIIVNETTDIFVSNVFKVGAAGDDGSLLIASPKSVEMEMEVFDRWGNLVYQATTDDQQLTWDGNLGGNIVEQGVYIVNLRVEFENGESIRQISNITIIR